MPNQIELKDAQQDQEIALLKHRVEQLEEGGDSKMVDELRERVRNQKRNNNGTLHFKWGGYQVGDDND